VNNQFDDVATNVRERPLSEDQNLQAAQASRTLRMMARLIHGGRAGDGSLGFPFTANYLAPFAGFMGDGFKVRAQSPSPTMEVVVGRGQGWQNDPSGNAANIGGLLGLNDSERFKPLPLETDQTLSVPAADPSNPRVDIVEVRYDRRLENPLSRDILNLGTGNFDPATVMKTLAWMLDSRTSVNGSAAINYKTGTPAGSPVAPTVTSGYMKIAEVLVGAGVGSIAQNKIIDARSVLAPGGVQTVRLRALVKGTTAGVGAALTVALLAPAGCTVAHCGSLTASVINTFIVCGGNPRNVVVRAWVENGGESRLLTESIGAVTSLELAGINGGTGVVEGQAIAEGQRAIKLGFGFYNYSNVLLAADSTVDIEVSFQS